MYRFSTLKDGRRYSELTVHIRYVHWADIYTALRRSLQVLCLSTQFSLRYAQGSLRSTCNSPRPRYAKGSLLSVLPVRSLRSVALCAHYSLHYAHKAHCYAVLPVRSLQVALSARCYAARFVRSVVQKPYIEFLVFPDLASLLRYQAWFVASVVAWRCIERCCWS